MWLFIQALIEDRIGSENNMTQEIPFWRLPSHPKNIAQITSVGAVFSSFPFHPDRLRGDGELTSLFSALPPLKIEGAQTGPDQNHRGRLGRGDSNLAGGERARQAEPCGFAGSQRTKGRVDRENAGKDKRHASTRVVH
jgi:hypothetical protein